MAESEKGPNKILRRKGDIAYIAAVTAANETRAVPLAVPLMLLLVSWP